jgi:hypothetical protein
MSKVVTHWTPGLIDRTAFTTFGVNAKPNSENPIGFFGTGLKYAIAVLVRMDIKVTLFIGLEEYVFYTQKDKFRDKDFMFVRMKRRKGIFAKWTYEKLPFTTELGKSWELWQAFRELHSNTLDEKGLTYVERDVDSRGNVSADTTRFIIDDSRYVDVYEDRDRIFLPDGLAVRESGGVGIQVIDRPSKHIYFRGLRIMDLSKPALFTYNFLQHVDLTEDRTAKFPSVLEEAIVETMQLSEDTAFVEKAVAKAVVSSFEGGLRHSGGSYYRTPTATYLAAAEKSPNVTAKEVWNQKQPTVPSSVSFRVIIPKAGMEPDEIADFVDYIRKAYEDCHIMDDQYNLLA